MRRINSFSIVLVAAMTLICIMSGQAPSSSPAAIEGSSSNESDKLRYPAYVLLRQAGPRILTGLKSDIANIPWCAA